MKPSSSSPKSGDDCSFIAAAVPMAAKVGIENTTFSSLFHFHKKSYISVPPSSISYWNISFRTFIIRSLSSLPTRVEEVEEKRKLGRLNARMPGKLRGASISNSFRIASKVSKHSQSFSKLNQTGFPLSKKENKPTYFRNPSSRDSRLTWSSTGGCHTARRLFILML